MNLLDFPSEIFERIIAHYVRKNGIRRAWKRRIICKTFHSYIKTEIFGRQPPSAFSHRWHLMNPLVHRILPFILEHRAVALYGFPDVLPKIINKTVDIFLEITETSSVEARSEWTRIVCHTLVGQTPRYKTISLTFDPSKAQARMIAEQSGEQEALAIAVLVGEKDVAAKLVARDVPMWAKVNVVSELGYPLRTATSAGNLEMVVALLANARRAVGSRNMRQQTLTVVWCLDHAIPQNEDIALVLLDWYETNIVRPDWRDRGHWFRCACENGRMTVLNKLITSKRSVGSREIFARVFLSNRKMDYAHDIVPLLLKHGVFEASNINSVGDNQECLLDISVKIGDCNLVKLVLDAGASAHGGRVAPSFTKTYPVRKAAQSRRSDIVDLLVTYGAHRDTWFARNGV